MDKRLILVLFMVASSFIYGQDGKSVSNFGLGISPYGDSWIKVKQDKEENLEFENYLNAHVFYESQFLGMSYLFEGSYAQMSYESGFSNNTPEELRKLATDDLRVYALYVYFGKTINAQKRIQFPIYFGIGGNYLSGKEFNNANLSYSGKFRIKFYVSNKIALYSGISYDTGSGEKEIDNYTSIKYNFTAYHTNLGITFNF